MRFDNEGEGCCGNGTEEEIVSDKVNPCEQEPTTDNYRPIKGSAVAASMVVATTTKKWVVGQNVNLVSGPYGCSGVVVRYMPCGVEVDTGGEILHFDDYGKGRDYEGTFECGPWYIEPTANSTAQADASVE